LILLSGEQSHGVSTTVIVEFFLLVDNKFEQRWIKIVARLKNVFGWQKLLKWNWKM